jgi:4-diphosphocytidyl-2-C-methyl-D-erythritol kinase
MLARDRPMPTTTAIAPAKINLFLRVLGRRSDGYHDLESVLVPISLADGLQIHAASDPGEFRTLSFSLEVSGEPDSVRGVPVDESNLVLKAAKALADRVGVRGFADIHLKKRIPPAAGLGGGSSDAAATLRALNDLWGAGLGDDELMEIAAEVGSDVPAMLRGGAVLIGGRGERVVEQSTSPLSGVLATFDFGVRTGDAYGWWDSDGGTTGPDPRPLLESVSGPVEVLGPILFNDLEEPVVRRHPQIGRVKEALLRGGAIGALMAGSGPTVFGLLSPGTELELNARREVVELSGRSVVDVAVGRLPSA